MEQQQRREKLGIALSAVRASAGLSQAQVAARLGRPQSFVSKYESAERKLDLADLEDIAGALGVSLEGMIERYRKEVDAS